MDPYADSTPISRSDRAASLDATHALETALAAPAPGREHLWLKDVQAALAVLVDLLSGHASTDDDSAGLLSLIETEQPRLAGRIGRLRQERDDLIANAVSLQRQLEHDDEPVDVADIRDRLAAMTRRFRQHRARESDLVYEATLVDIGGPG